MSQPSNNNVVLVFATDQIIKDFTSPSINPNEPTQLNNPSKYVGVVAAGTQYGITTIGPNGLALPAAVGDSLRFVSTSEYNNDRQAAVIYKLTRFKGDKIVADTFTLTDDYKIFTPIATTDSHQQTQLTYMHEDFCRFSSAVLGNGSAMLSIVFAVTVNPSNSAHGKTFGFFELHLNIIL